MQHAPSTSSDKPGYLLPENMHELLFDVCDELQLLVTTEALDGRVLPMDLKSAALAGYLHGVSERIEAALRQCRYPARFTGAGAEAA